MLYVGVSALKDMYSSDNYEEQLMDALVDETNVIQQRDHSVSYGTKMIVQQNH